MTCSVVLLTLLLFHPLGLIYSILGLLKQPSKWKRYLPFLLYIVLVSSYAYNPPIYDAENFDLIRYIPEIEYYGTLSFEKAFQQHDDILFSRDILFWAFGNLNIPHMVPALTTAIVYAIACYITCDTADRYNANQHIGKILLFQFAMIPYISVINNIRNVFGYSIIILAIYLDVIKKKRNLFVIFCYAFGALMHLSSFALILFRLFSSTVKKFFELVIILPVFFSSVIYFLYENRLSFTFAGSFGSSVQLIVFKLYSYLTNETSAYALKAMTSVTFFVDRWIINLEMILAIILLYYIIRFSKVPFVDDKCIYVFAGLLVSMTLAFNVFALPNYWRIAASFNVLVGILLMPYLCNFKSLPPLIKTVFSCFLMMPFLGLFIQIWKYRAIDFLGWFFDTALTNVFTILFDIIN